MTPRAFAKPRPVYKESGICLHHHTAPVDAKGRLTYPGVGWPKVAGHFCYKCQTYQWQGGK